MPLPYGYRSLFFSVSFMIGGYLWLSGPGGNPPAVQEAILQRQQRQRIAREQAAARIISDKSKEQE